MCNHSQRTHYKSAGFFAKGQFSLLTAFIFGLTLTACSSSGPNSSSGSNNSSSKNQRPEFQKRIQAETDAEDQRDRNALVQEQTRKEEVHLRKLRAERAAQRNAQREAAAQQEE
jgi:hypothetical protein